LITSSFLLIKTDLKTIEFMVSFDCDLIGNDVFL